MLLLVPMFRKMPPREVMVHQLLTPIPCAVTQRIRRSSLPEFCNKKCVFARVSKLTAMPSLGQLAAVRVSLRPRHSLVAPLSPAGSLAAIISLLLVAAMCGSIAAEGPAPSAAFPPDLVSWRPRANNPVFIAAGLGHWDVKIRERGWILRDKDGYRMWFTGYDGNRDSRKLLGLATSPDGLKWTRSPKNPLVRDHWVEDVTVIEEKSNYYMFAEGEHDNHAELLTSPDGLTWTWQGELEVRAADGRTAAKKPCGTPTVWVENGVWYLFYEWNDKGVWLARSSNPLSRVWTNVQNAAILLPGPADYDKDMIAMDQVIKRDGIYYAIYHGSGSGEAVPRTWSPDIARPTDLEHWEKYAHNPIVADNKSSGEIVETDAGPRLYTMHDQVDVFEPAN